MRDSLSVYLQDHLAGAAHATDLVAHLRDEHPGEDLGRFAAELLRNIKEDERTLRDLAERVGDGSSSLKEAGAWLSEKIARLKLSHDSGGGLGLLEALEFLSLGIQGKLSLWRNLQVAAADEPRLRGIDLERLIARAHRQHAQVESWRLHVAHVLFAGGAARDAREEDARGPWGVLFGSPGKAIASVALLAVAGVAAVSLAPDFKRYMKIRSM
jgi:hypothetical protein